MLRTSSYLSHGPTLPCIPHRHLDWLSLPGNTAPTCPLLPREAEGSRALLPASPLPCLGFVSPSARMSG